jgi:hypothetical protein
MKKTNKNETKLLNRINLSVIKRSMHKTPSVMIPNMSLIRKPLLGKTLPFLPQRNFANRFHATQWEPNNLGLTQHEKTHIDIIDAATGKVIALFTSSKGNNLPNDILCVKISDIKYNGAYIPKLNSITKQPVMDDYGFSIPHTLKGGQYVAVFKHAREVTPQAVQFMAKLPQYQEFLDKHEDKILELLKQTDILNNPVKIIDYNEN